MVTNDNGPEQANVIGIHALVWVGGTTPDELARAVRSTKDSGFGLLELSLHDLNSLDVSATRRALDQANIEVACSRGLAFEADVSSDDNKTVRRGERLLVESLDAAYALGSKILTGVLYSALGKYRAQPSLSGRKNAEHVLRELAREADKRGMTLGLEVVNRYETNLVNTALDARRLVEDIGEDNVLLHLDTFHMNIEESDVAQPVLDAGDRLGYVHVGECHRGYLGSGSIDFPQFFRSLAKVDYRGPITFESFSSTVVSAGLSNDLAVWRNLWSDGGDLARQARAYIGAQIGAASKSV